MLQKIESGLKARFDGQLVGELLEAYRDAKHNFFLGGLRLSAVEAGRFCEAAFRMLEQATSGKFTPLGTQINTEAIISALAKIPKANAPDSIRIHIPRALRVVYDIRSKRDAAHLADGIDPNLQDATLVASVLDWVLAEFVRLYHGVDANEAQRIIDRLVARKAPAVEDFDGFLKVLKPSLQVRQYVLLLLYERGPDGANFEQLEMWVRPSMRKNLKRTLGQMVDDLAFVHEAGGIYFLTKLGVSEVETKRLHDM